MKKQENKHIGTCKWKIKCADFSYRNSGNMYIRKGKQEGIVHP